mgnify:CR=1 FL=1
MAVLVFENGRVCEGELEYKVITGVRDNKRQLVLMELPGQIVKPDENIPLQYGEPFERSIREFYTDIEYHAILREKDALTAYEVDRHIYREMAFDKTNRYDVSRSKINELFT